MAINFSCPGCSQPYTIPESGSGKRLKCKKCGGPLIVPQGEDAEFLPLNDDDLWGSLDELAEPSRHSPPGDPLASGRSKAKPLAWSIAQPPRLYAALAGGALGLLLLAGLGWVLFGSRDPHPQVSLSSDDRSINESDASRAPAGLPPPAATQLPFDRAAERSPRGTTGGESVRPAPPSAAPSGDPPAAPDGKGFPEVPWSAVVDPPVAADPPFQVKEPLALPVQRSVEIVMPRTASPYVLLVSDVPKQEGILLLDLRTGEPAGQLSGKLGVCEPYAVSADGRYFAALENSRRSVSVIELPGGRRQEIQLAGSDRVKQLLWIANAQLLTVQDKLGEPTLALWDLESGRTTSLTVPRTSDARFVNDSVAVSPGGRFVMLMMGQTLCAYELATGRCAGTIALPPAGGYAKFASQGICFSADGSQLAMFASSSSKYVLFCWDFASGQELLARHFAERPYGDYTATAYQGPGLVWLPGGGGLLLRGQILLDRTSGSPVWTLPSTTYHPRMALDATRFVLVEKNATTNVVSLHKVPEQQLAEAVKLVRNGARPDDVGLPPLTPVDLSAAPQLASPQPDVTWTYAADPVPGPRQSLSRPLRLPSDLSLPQRAIFAREADVVMLLWNVRNQRSESPPTSVLWSYRLGGTARSELPLPAALRLLAVGPQGKHVLLGNTQKTFDSARLEVWEVATQTHVAAWRPYAAVNDSRHETVRWAEFVDEQHVLTGNAGEQVVLWRLPDCRPVYALGSCRPLALSPGGRCVALWDAAARRLVVRDALSGECRGMLQQGPRSVPPTAATFRRDGLALAISDQNSLLIWNLQTGELDRQIFLGSFFPHSLRWLDNRYVLSDHRHLIDTQIRAAVWKYDSPNAIVADGSLDDGFWFVSTDPQQEMPGHYLGELKIPSGIVRAQTAGLKLEDLLILGPGGTARLTVFAGVAGADAQRIIQTLTKKLANNGVTIDNASPVNVVLSSSQRSTGETLRYESFPGMGLPSVVEIPVQAISASLTISDNKGRKWSQKAEFQTGGSTFERGDVQQNLANRLRGEFEGFANGVSIPKYVYPLSDSEQLGGSRLTLRGELPMPPSGR